MKLYDLLSRVTFDDLIPTLNTLIIKENQLPYFKMAFDELLYSNGTFSFVPKNALDKGLVNMKDIDTLISRISFSQPVNAVMRRPASS